MQEILKLRSRKDGFHMESEAECSNRLLLIKPEKFPIVDKLACLFNGRLYKDIFPFTLDSKKPYRVNTEYPQFVDPSGGPFMEKGIILDEERFFKHKVSKPTKTQMIGCEQGPCVKDEEEEEEDEYIESDKEVVDIMFINGVGAVIFLIDKEEDNESSDESSDGQEEEEEESQEP